MSLTLTEALTEKARSVDPDGSFTVFTVVVCAVFVDPEYRVAHSSATMQIRAPDQEMAEDIAAESYERLNIEQRGRTPDRIFVAASFLGAHENCEMQPSGLMDPVGPHADDDEVLERDMELAGYPLDPDDEPDDE